MAPKSEEAKQAAVERSRAWRLANPERAKANWDRLYKKNRAERPEVLKARNEKTKNKLRQEVVDAYGGMCACCGEDDRRFLAIDHINRDGAEHRKAIGRPGGIPFYHWLRKNDYPPGFQVLCHNCNWASFWNDGVCPHKEKDAGPILLIVEEHSSRMHCTRLT